MQSRTATFPVMTTKSNAQVKVLTATLAYHPALARPDLLISSHPGFIRSHRRMPNLNHITAHHAAGAAVYLCSSPSPGRLVQRHASSRQNLVVVSSSPGLRGESRRLVGAVPSQHQRPSQGRRGPEVSRAGASAPLHRIWRHAFGCRSRPSHSSCQGMCTQALSLAVSSSSCSRINAHNRDLKTDAAALQADPLAGHVARISEIQFVRSPNAANTVPSTIVSSRS